MSNQEKILKSLIESLIAEMDLVSQCKICGEDLEPDERGPACDACEDEYESRLAIQRRREEEEKENERSRYDITRMPMPGIMPYVRESNRKTKKV